MAITYQGRTYRVQSTRDLKALIAWLRAPQPRMVKGA